MFYAYCYVYVYPTPSSFSITTKTKVTPMFSLLKPPFTADKIWIFDCDSAAGVVFYSSTNCFVCIFTLRINISDMFANKNITATTSISADSSCSVSTSCFNFTTINRNISQFPNIRTNCWRKFTTKVKETTIDDNIPT